MEQPLVNNSNATSTSAREAAASAAAAAKYNLRIKSIQNRIEVERRKNEPRHPKPKQRPAPLSKYRRRTANFRERCRMQEMNDAFKRLQSVVPGDEQTGVTTTSVKQSLGSAASAAAASKATKIHTLKLAVNYISALTAMLNGQSQSQEHCAVPARTQTQFGLVNNTNNHCTQSSVSRQTMTFMMEPKNKACQTITGNSSCVTSASQTEQPRQCSNSHSQISDLNNHNLNHCQQSPLQYSYSAQTIGCIPGQNSVNKLVPPNSNFCEISPTFYGYSNQPMSQQLAVQPVMPVFGSADNINNSNLFLPSGHSRQQSVNTQLNNCNNITVSHSPFDSLGDSSHHHHYSLVSNQALDDFSAIIDDLQQVTEEEDSTFALVDGLID